MNEIYLILTQENGVYDVIETDYGKILMTEEEAYKELQTWQKSFAYLKPIIKKLSNVDESNS